MYGYDDSHMTGGGVTMVVLMVLLIITVLAAVGVAAWALVRLSRYKDREQTRSDQWCDSRSPRDSNDE